MYFGDDGATIDAATLEDHDPAWLRARRVIVATRRSVEALYVADEINQATRNRSNRGGPCRDGRC